MRKSIAILVSCSSILLLCGCKEATTIQTSQPPINVYTSVANEEAAAKKTTTNSKTTKTTNKNNKTNKTNSTTTTTTTPKTSNSTIKDLIIDGNGNLVATKSNNSFAIIGNIQGVQGPAGPQGPQGGQGPQGEPGRGIASCNVDSNGDLIITYTDGTTQNAGNVRQEVVVHDYEQVGYELYNPDNYPINKSVHLLTSGFQSIGYITFNISSTSIKLVAINHDNPSLKYKYQVSVNYTIDKGDLDSSQWNSPSLGISFGFDSTSSNNFFMRCPYGETSAVTFFETDSPFAFYEYLHEGGGVIFDVTKENKTIFYNYP